MYMTLYSIHVGQGKVSFGSILFKQNGEKSKLFRDLYCTCILSSFREYAADVNVLVAKLAIRAIGQISLQLSTRANTCVDKLLSLLTMEIDYVTSETLVAMTSE